MYIFSSYFWIFWYQSTKFLGAYSDPNSQAVIIAPLLISTPEQIQVFRFLDKECKQVYKITFI